MSDQPLTIEIEIEGLSLLGDALVNAPQTVDQALYDANREVIGILSPAVDAVTRVDTGFMVSNNEFSVPGMFTVMYSNLTPYVGVWEERDHFVEQGVENVRDEVEQVYEDAMDEVADTFAGGR